MEQAPALSVSIDIPIRIIILPGMIKVQMSSMQRFSRARITAVVVLTLAVEAGTWLT